MFLLRSLTVDPIALKSFFDKAQRLRSTDSSTSTNQLDLTSTDTNALLAFANNEQELIQLRQKINEMDEKLQELDSAENEQRLKNEHRKVKQSNHENQEEFLGQILVGK